MFESLNLFTVTSRRQVVAGILIALALCAFFDWKLAFVGSDGNRLRYGRPTSLFNDDGSNYIAIAEAIGEGEKLTGQRWYREIREKTVAEDFEVSAWGRTSMRVRQAVGHVPAPGWAIYVAGLQRFLSLFSAPTSGYRAEIGTYREAFRWSIAFFPFFLGLMLFFLFRFFGSCGQLHLAFFAAIFLWATQVQGHNFFWATSSAYAWLSFVPLAMIWVWGEKNKGNFAWMCLLFILTSLFHSIALTVGAMFMAIALAERLFPDLMGQVLNFFSRRILWCIAITAAAALLARFYWYPLQSLRPSAIRLWWESYHTSFFVYLSPSILLLVAAIHSLSRESISLAAQRAILASIGLCAGIFLLAVAAPFLSPMLNQNTNRYLEYYYAFLAIAVYELLRNKIAEGMAGARLLASALSGFIVLNSGATMIPTMLSFQEHTGLVMHVYKPKLVVEPSGFRYLEAHSVSEAYSYFVNEGYRIAPLVLALKVGQYDPEEVKALLRLEPRRTYSAPTGGEAPR